MGAYEGFVFDEPPIWIPISLEGSYRKNDLLPLWLFYSNQGPVIVIFMSTYLLNHCLHKVQLVMLTNVFPEG